MRASTCRRSWRPKLFAHYCGRSRARAGLRPSGVCLRLRGFRRPAQHAASGALGAPAAAGRQAAVCAAFPAHLGISAAQPARIRAWRRWRRGTTGTFRSLAQRHAAAVAEPMEKRSRGWPAQLTTAMVLSAGLGTRMAPANSSHAQAAGAAQRQGADRSCARPAGGGRHQARRRQCASQGRPDRAHLRGAASARPSRSPTSAATLLDTGGGVKKALPRLGPAPS